MQSVQTPLYEVMWTQTPFHHMASLCQIQFTQRKSNYSCLHLPNLNVVYQSQSIIYCSPLRHICVSKLASIGWDNGVSHGRWQAIIWTYAGIDWLILYLRIPEKHGLSSWSPWSTYTTYRFRLVGHSYIFAWVITIKEGKKIKEWGEKVMWK